MRPGARFTSSAGSTRTKRRLLGRRPPQVCPEANELLLKSKERLEAVAMNLLDDICEPGPLLTPEAVKPPNISKATVQRCISKLSPYWTDEQLDQVVEMFQAHGLL